MNFTEVRKEIIKRFPHFYNDDYVPVAYEFVYADVVFLKHLYNLPNNREAAMCLNGPSREFYFYNSDYDEGIKRGIIKKAGG